MNEIDTFVKADQRLAGVVDRIPDDRWAEQVPSDFPTFDDGSYTFRQILDYQAYDEAWIPDMMAGRTIEDVGGDSYGDPHGSDLLGDAPAQRFRDLTNKAIDAVIALEESELDDRTVHYSYGDYSAREALWHAVVFRAMRSYDIAKAVGIDSTLPDDLTAATWDIVEPNAEEWRAMGVFGPAVEVPHDASLQDRLLGLTGRRP
ncbi:MAG: hypothetical protein ACR2HP_12990 [Ilumatobacteraceae bacterium]